MTLSVANLFAAVRLLGRHLAHTGLRPTALGMLLRRAWRELRAGRLEGIVARHARHADLYRDYERWRLRPDRDGEARVDAFVASGRGPTVSLLMPTCESEPRWLRAAVESVLAQRYRNWELIIVDDASTASATLVLLDELRTRDDRIRVTRLDRRAGISGATNAALQAARGEFVGFVDHDDLLDPDALAWIAAAVTEEQALDFVYTDEDKVDAKGRHFWPVFKPAWNPDLLLANNYITHFMVIRRALAVEVGGLRAELDGAQDWDLALRATERLPPSAIGQVPRVLYHWRSARGSTAAGIESKPYAEDAQRRCVADTLRRRAVDAEIVRTQFCWRVRCRWPAAAAVSIVIPTRDRIDLLSRTLDAIDAHVDRRAQEIVIVDNGSTDRATIETLARWGQEQRIRSLRVAEPFNFSNLVNAGVTAAVGSIIVLLNNDVRPLEYGWLDELAAQAARPGIGAVGALLLYPNGNIQHAGILLGINGTTEHAFRGYPRSWAGVNGRAKSVQDISAVTGACMAFSRSAFVAAGGFDPTFAESHNDVDFCLRLRCRGYRVLWTPFAVLEHDESATRGYALDLDHQLRLQSEADAFGSRWRRWIADDPAYNPNLASMGAAFSLNREPHHVVVRSGSHPTPPCGDAGCPQRAGTQVAD